MLKMQVKIGKNEFNAEGNDDVVREQFQVFMAGIRCVQQETHRTPLKFHKEKLIDYMTERGETTRCEIAAKLGIPSGSLTEILSGPEFESISRGRWKLTSCGVLTEGERE